MPSPTTSPAPEADARLGLLREQIAQAVAEQLCRADIDWDALELLGQPALRIEATLHDATSATAPPQTRRQRQAQPLPVLSHVIDLTEVVTHRSAASTPRTREQDINGNDSNALQPGSIPDKQVAGTIVPARAARQPVRDLAADSPSLRPGTPHANEISGTSGREPSLTTDQDADADEDVTENDTGVDDRHQENNPRKAISGLRPSRAPIQLVEDANTQRQMQVGDKSFPKRRKIEPAGYALKPSTLDKLIVGIWEQIHSTTTLNPQDLLGHVSSTPASDESGKGIAGRPTPAPTGEANAIQNPPSSLEIASLSMPGLSAHSNGNLGQAGQQSFSHKNIFCRRVTQASRTCRSIEVIVQARWIEHFEAHIEASKATSPSLSDTKHRKAALIEACHDFGWSEKELRNKMAVWRGYKEIKDAGGWSALVFAGMGIYRFCKYRIGFDKDSLQRLRNLRPALEVAADTMHPHWRQLLTVVDLPTQPMYTGHRHDWVVFPDGSVPVPLHTTYLQWDVNFNYKHIDESVVDEQQWGGDDPRWAPPMTMIRADATTQLPHSGGFAPGPESSLLATVSMPVCTVCDKEQSDDPRLNACMCFPSLFGCANPAPSPVQVFRTKERSNGLLALCAFERGSLVGEFVGLVTKGLENVDVMEGCTSPVQYSQGLSSASLSTSSYSPSPAGIPGGMRSPSRAGFPPPSLLSSTSSLSSSSKTSFIAHHHHGHHQRQQHHHYSQHQNKQQPGVRYQIWQGRQGNFTRFVNHSCNANAQYQTFTWLGTQRIILVSKGIEAGTEITVDYSDKYWKGLDKKCLCGEKSCRYRRGGS
ncbi:uncharacterized protein B0I36DRAFT_407689 [Microdochium trichocladiopsis]|uniref:SET domain-containing protein n=1 Tax=Microdochium trichocladiopsis TaxID=1682393 RepID=A0A9P8Y8I8_9PEZI|nr:uncharacterized protein B0I36DRAFT_407689 [Microdochium trichocladiopsis]KAH7033077.1 hypothetical protein B0I36DRAFT_407689 [Microdochium trichocladiopsis]